VLTLKLVNVVAKASMQIRSKIIIVFISFTDLIALYIL